jgi:dihydrofolate reductase
MRRVVVSEFMSLDGVVEAPGPVGDFEHAGWTMPYWSDELGQLKFDELFASDALLLGRVTYQEFAAAWPGMTDGSGFGDRMNNLPKYVVSTTLTESDWGETRIISADVAEQVSELKEQPGQDILVTGSGTLVDSLLPYGVIDELRLAVYPVVLGSGKRLFSDLGKTNLKLADSRALDSGVTLLTYEPA